MTDVRCRAINDDTPSKKDHAEVKRFDRLVRET
jgi:hypothetical protein